MVVFVHPNRTHTNLYTLRQFSNPDVRLFRKGGNGNSVTKIHNNQERKKKIVDLAYTTF